jgi:hypothetical protein
LRTASMCGVYPGLTKLLKCSGQKNLVTPYF